MMTRLRNTMLTGLIALLPLYLSFVLLVWLFKTVDALAQPWLAHVFHVTIPGLGIVATALIVFLTGAIVSSVSGALVPRWVDRLVDQVPIVKGVVQRHQEDHGKFQSQQSVGIQGICSG